MSEERVDVRGILRIYFFLRVKKERRLGSSLEAEAGRVWDLPGPLSPEALIGEPNKKTGKHRVLFTKMGFDA